MNRHKLASTLYIYIYIKCTNEMKMELSLESGKSKGLWD
jgi:hypothetical protein